MARTAWLKAVTVTAFVSMVCADLAETYPMSEVLDWQVDSQMQLSVTSDGDLLPILYAVIPLTADLGLNETQTDRGVICASLILHPHPIALALENPRG